MLHFKVKYEPNDDPSTLTQNVTLPFVAPVCAASFSGCYKCFLGFRPLGSGHGLLAESVVAVLLVMFRAFGQTTQSLAFSPLLPSPMSSSVAPYATGLPLV